MTTTIKELIEKVSEQDVGLWEMRQFSITIRDTKGRMLRVTDIKVDPDKKNIRIKVE
jgi:hypothetical protein